MGIFGDQGGMDWSQILGEASAMPPVQPPPDFRQRFGAAFPQAQAQPTMAQSPISPEALAANAAARGIPPPPVDMAPTNPNLPPMRMPPAEAVDAWRKDSDMMRGVGTGDVGAALTGNTVDAAPKSFSGASAPTSLAAPSTDISAQSKPKKDELDAFAKALQGVKAPASPVLQHISTPAAPRPTSTIKGGDLVALLQALNAAPGAGAQKLPTTLVQALGR